MVNSRFENVIDVFGLCFQRFIVGFAESEQIQREKGWLEKVEKGSFQTRFCSKLCIQIIFVKFHITTFFEHLVSEPFKYQKLHSPLQRME